MRYDTILKKVQPSKGDAICWQFDLERITITITINYYYYYYYY